MQQFSSRERGLSEDLDSTFQRASSATISSPPSLPPFPSFLASSPPSLFSCSCFLSPAGPEIAGSMSKRAPQPWTCYSMLVAVGPHYSFHHSRLFWDFDRCSRRERTKTARVIGRRSAFAAPVVVCGATSAEVNLYFF